MIEAALRREEGFWTAVLPFKFSGDPEIAGFAEGLTEEIVTGMARFPYLRVIAPELNGALSLRVYCCSQSRQRTWRPLPAGGQPATGGKQASYRCAVGGHRFGSASLGRDLRSCLASGGNL